MKWLALLSLVVITGCASQVKYIEKPVYLKCQIPEIPESDLDSVPEDASYPEKLRAILNNYLKIKRENELLREAVKLCQ